MEMAERESKLKRERIASQMDLVEEATKQPVFNETQVGIFESGYVDSYAEVLKAVDEVEAIGNEKVKKDKILLPKEVLLTDKDKKNEVSPLEKYMYEIAQEMGLSLRSSKAKNDKLMEKKD